MKLNGWDHALKVTATGEGLVGHARAILLRKAADVTGLTSLLSGALEEKGKLPLLDRGTVLVLTAAAIALGATSMSDVALLRHLAPLMGSGPGGLRWIARRVKPSRRHKKNLTALHIRISGQSILATVAPGRMQNGMDPATFAGFDYNTTWSIPSEGFYPELYGVSHVLNVTAEEIADAPVDMR